MVVASYFRRLEPILYEAEISENVRPEDNFYFQIAKRFTGILNLLDRTVLIYKSKDTVAGITSSKDPYLLAVSKHPVNELGGFEVGIFSRDSDIVKNVRVRTETGLPPWIELGETRDLNLWCMEDVYAIFSKRGIVRN